jgi:PPP family 3-phenylpropionic acid transporter
MTGGSGLEARRRSSDDRRVRRLFGYGGASGAAWIPFFTALLAGRGMPADQIGLVLAASALAGAIAAPMWSHEADTRLGAARALSWSALAASGCALLQAFTGANPWLVGLVAMAMAAAWGPGAALLDSVALTSLGPERSGSYGVVRAFASGGWAIAAIAFGAVYQGVDLWLMIPLFAASEAGFAFAAMRMASPPVPRADGPRAPRLTSARDAFRGAPRLASFLGGLMLFSVAASATDGFVPLEMLGEDGGPFLIGLAAGLGAALEIPFFVASGRLVSRLGGRTLMVTGLAMGTAVMLGWAAVDSPTTVAAIRVLAGAGFGLKYAATVLLTDRLVPTHLRSTGQSLLQVATWSVGPIVGPAVGGFVYVHAGPPWLFAGAGLLAAVGTGLAWWSLRGIDDGKAGGTDA